MDEEEDPDKDKDFYKDKDPFDATIEHQFSTSMREQGAEEYVEPS